jgi:hypothetical protein
MLHQVLETQEWITGSFSYVCVPPPKASPAFDFYFYFTAPMSLFMDMTISWGRGFGVSKNRSVTLFKHVGCNARAQVFLTLLLHHTKCERIIIDSLSRHYWLRGCALRFILWISYRSTIFVSVGRRVDGVFFCWYLWCICPFFFGLSFSRIHPSEVPNPPAVISLTAVDRLAKGKLILHWVCMISTTTWSRVKAVQMDDRCLERCFYFRHV